MYQQKRCMKIKREAGWTRNYNYLIWTNRSHQPQLYLNLTSQDTFLATATLYCARENNK